MRKWLTMVLLSMGLAATATTASAATYQLPLPADSVIGQIQTVHAQPGLSLDDIARQYDIGYYEILEANPHVNPQNIKPYETITIPSQFILPNTPREGIVVNLAELRLYYYPPGTHTVQTYPIGIGMQGSNTPVGQYYIIEKEKNPVWYVPKQVQSAMIQQGWLLPRSVPAGPNNPLGDYAMRLNIPSYLIHGTNVPPTIGRRASAGCMHMFPEDIAYLFPQIALNTPVTIINQPFKAGWAGTQLYFQAREPLHEDKRTILSNYSSLWNQAIQNAIAGITPPPAINWQTVKQAGAEQSGIPVVIANIG
jgi:L,D-transpeptidase ErfK/SrfK